MKILEILALPNGAHRNQTHHGGDIPAGWAVLPIVEPENFPFGEVEVANINGVPTVVKWIPGEMPEPPDVEPPTPSTDTPSVWDELDAAYQEGVNSAYDS